MSERFQFTIEVAANAGAVTALTQATQSQTAATHTLRQAEQSRISLPVPDMVLAQQRRNAVQELVRQTAAERAANLERGRMWEEQRRARGTMGQGGDGAGAGGFRGNSGLAALEVSRAFEDAQYGIAGVLNNLPSLVMMLGGGAGLAGALSIAAVGATQLYKQLSGLGGALDEEAMKKQIAALGQIFDAAQAAMSERTRARMDADLEAMQAKVDAKLAAMQQSMKGLDAGVKRDAEDASARESAGGVAAAVEAAQIGVGATPEEQAANAAAMTQQAQDLKDSQARAKLEQDAIRARQRRQIAEQGIQAAGGVIAGAEAVNGPFGETARSARQQILDEMARVGISSDQARQVQGYDRAAGDAETFGTAARAAEERRDSMSPLNPLRIAEARKAARLREQASQAEQQQAALAPGVEDARAAMAAGNVTFGAVDEKNLTPAQRQAFNQGRAALDAQAAREKAARDQVKAAEAAKAEAQRAAEAAKAEEMAVEARRQEFEVSRQARRMAAGELPDMPPEQFGPMAAAVRDRAGLAGVPELPMSGGFAPPDLSGTEQAFGEAMSQTSSAVTSTMERLVSSSERMAAGVSSQLAALIARISQLETNVANIGNP